MPAMPRAKSKATKIAHSILGIPQNIRNKTKNTKMRQKLYSEDARLVR